jgi:cysteine desulfurase / selenocysteine lyase
LLENLPPYQGGGEMISKVEYFRTTYNVPPHRFEAGTPHIEGAVGLHAALDYVDAVGRDHIFAHDQDLAEYCADRLREFDGIRIFGPKKGRAGLVSFVLPQAHALDVATLIDQRGIAVRAGHHCNQPLMAKLGVPATLRASFYFYNTRDEVDRFIDVLRRVVKMLGT